MCEERIIIEIEIESSQYAEGSYWSYGCDGYYEKIKLSIPASMADIDDDDLFEMADLDNSEVRYA